MASGKYLENEYSDHSILTLRVPASKISDDTFYVKQLNVSQLGRVQLFPNNEVEEGFNWSST